jgi:hypothetical protein
MNTNLTFHRSGTGPAGRRAGRVPSLPITAIHPPCQPAIPDEGRSEKKYVRLIIIGIVSFFAFLEVSNAQDSVYFQVGGKTIVPSSSDQKRISRLMRQVVHDAHLTYFIYIFNTPTPRPFWDIVKDTPSYLLLHCSPQINVPADGKFLTVDLAIESVWICIESKLGNDKKFQVDRMIVANGNHVLDISSFNGPAMRQLFLDPAILDHFPSR